MPLTYDLSDIKMFKGTDFESAYVEINDGFGNTVRDLDPYIKSLVFSGGMVGLGRITISNVDEWYARLKLCEEVYNSFLIRRYSDEREEFVDEPLDPKMLIKYIGLSTNHSQLTRSEWLKNMKRYHKDVIFTQSQLTQKVKNYINEFKEMVYND